MAKANYQYRGSTHYFDKVPQKKGIPWWVWALGVLLLIGWANSGKSEPPSATPVSYSTGR
jgi:hypothetical protein